MQIPELRDSFAAAVNRVTLGGSDNGSPRASLTIGGAANVAQAGPREQSGEKPIIAMDVLDVPPDDWHENLRQCYDDVLDSPAEWARKCVELYGADTVCVRFDGLHPDKGDRDADHAARVTADVLAAVDVPLILWGSENREKDALAMPAISQAAKGHNCLVGPVEEDNYKTLTAIALADGHHLITKAPLDINIAKQVNILVSEMGFPYERIVTFQATGALGYGIEYAYSIQERQRLAALAGDRMMSMPVICDVGYEAWRVKEARLDDENWGPVEQRGPLWEAITAICLLQAGADILRMRHPKAVQTVKQFIAELWN